jgi:hypothetical protein
MTLRELRPDAMNQLSHSVESAGHVSGQLAGIFETHSFHRQGISDAQLKEYTFVDIDLADSSHLSDLRARLKLRPRHGKVIFAVEQGVRRQALLSIACWSPHWP